MTIRHENVAVGRNGHAGWTVERVRSVATHAFRADCPEHLAGRADLADHLAHGHALLVPGSHAENGLVVIGIGGPDVSVPVDGESVWMREESGTEAPQKPSCGSEFENRRVGVASIETGRIAGRFVVEAAVEDPNVAVRSGVHPDNLSPLPSIRSAHARGKRGPVRHEAIRIWERGGFRDRRIRSVLVMHRDCHGGHHDGSDHDATNSRHAESPAESRLRT